MDCDKQKKNAVVNWTAKKTVIISVLVTMVTTVLEHIRPFQTSDAARVLQRLPACIIMTSTMWQGVPPRHPSISAACVMILAGIPLDEQHQVLAATVYRYSAIWKYMVNPWTSRAGQVFIKLIKKLPSRLKLQCRVYNETPHAENRKIVSK